MAEEKSLRERLVKAGTDPDAIAANGFTYLELHEAFDLVKNEENWKLPIAEHVWIPSGDERTRPAIAAAVTFFTGGVACFNAAVTTRRGQLYVVSAPGYYVSVGA